MKKTSDLQALTTQISAFCKERDWDQFHNPKDLAIGVVTEAGELLDLFRFKDLSEIKARLKDKKFRESFEDEMADVFFFLLRLAERAEVDLPQALKRKMKKNAAKYPVSKSRGSNRKYTELRTRQK